MADWYFFLESQEMNANYGGCYCFSCFQFELYRVSLDFWTNYSVEDFLAEINYKI